MPRITFAAELRLQDLGRASMRPGRNAPDNVPIFRIPTEEMNDASMRPGRNAPDNAAGTRPIYLAAPIALQ